MYVLHTLLSPFLEPNTGLVLWAQQFWAMFLKRIYNTLRFYGALVSQLFLPILFVLFGLLVAVTVPSNQVDDSPRTLLLNNSGQIRDVTVFFAQFGSSRLNLSVSGYDGGGGGGTRPFRSVKSTPNTGTIYSKPVSLSFQFECCVCKNGQVVIVGL